MEDSAALVFGALPASPVLSARNSELEAEAGRVDSTARPRTTTDGSILTPLDLPMLTDKLVVTPTLRSPRTSSNSNESPAGGGSNEAQPAESNESVAPIAQDHAAVTTQQINDVVSLLLENTENAAVAAECAVSLVELTSEDSTGEAALAVIASGGAVCIVRALRAHVAMVDIVEACCDVIRNISASAPVEASDILANAQCPTALVAAVDAHADSCVVAEAATNALRNLAISAGDAVVAADGARAIVGALQRFGVGDAAVGAAACAALSNLAVGAGTAGATAALNAGCLHAIIEALATHHDNAIFCVAACSALCELAPTIVDLDAAGISDAARVLVAALEEHADTTAVAESACAALCELSRGGGNASAAAVMPAVLVVAAGGAIAVVEALRLHTRVAGVAAAAAAALCNLSASGPVGADAIVVAGGVAVLISALSDGAAGAPAVAAPCCSAIYNLSLLPSIAPRVYAEGGAQAVASAMLAHREDRRIAASLCGVLAALVSISTVAGGNDVIVEGGGALALVYALTTAGDDETVARSGTAALSLLARTTAGVTRAEVARNGASRAFVAVLSQHDTARDIVVTACDGLAALSGSVERAVGSAGASEDSSELHRDETLLTLAAVLESDLGGGDEGIAVSACTALARLVGPNVEGKDGSARTADASPVQAPSSVAARLCIQATIRALNAHPASPLVTTAALEALAGLATVSMDAREEATERGAIHAAIAAMMSHDRDVFVVRAGCASLRAIATAPRSPRWSFGGGGRTPKQSALRKDVQIAWADSGLSRYLAVLGGAFAAAGLSLDVALK